MPGLERAPSSQGYVFSCVSSFSSRRRRSQTWPKPERRPATAQGRSNVTIRTSVDTMSESVVPLCSQC